MCLSACKIPINDGAAASQVSFHKLMEHPKWVRLSIEQQEKILKAAIVIDEIIIKRYGDLNQEIIDAYTEILP